MALIPNIVKGAAKLIASPVTSVASAAKQDALKIFPTPSSVSKAIKQDLGRVTGINVKTPQLKSSSAKFNSNTTNKNIQRILNTAVSDVRQLKTQLDVLGTSLINIDNKITAVQEDTKTLAKMQTTMLRDANRNFSLIQKQLDKIERQNIELRQVAMFEKYNKRRKDLLSDTSVNYKKSENSGNAGFQFPGMLDILKGAGYAAGAALLTRAATKTYDLVTKGDIDESTRSSISAAARTAKLAAKPVTAATKLAAKAITPRVIKDAVEKRIKQQTSKIVGKKVPVIGALLGSAFAAYRLIQGDKVGAGLEFASGISSSLPVAGTAVGLTLDVTLIVRDIFKDVVGRYPLEGDNAKEDEELLNRITKETFLFLANYYNNEKKKEDDEITVKEFTKNPAELTTDKEILKILEFWKSNPEFAGKKGPEKTNPLNLGKATRLYYNNTQDVKYKKFKEKEMLSISQSGKGYEESLTVTEERSGYRKISSDPKNRSASGKTEIKDKELILSSDSPHTIILDSETILFKKQGVKLTKNGFESVAGGKTPEWAKKVFDESYTEPKKTFGRRNYRTSGRSFVDDYIDQKTIDSKQDFLAYGKLPKGFEFLPGHMGTLGSPGAVMARGAMPYSGGGGGYSGGVGGGYSGGGGGGYSGGGGGGGSFGGGDNNTSVTGQTSISNQNNNQSFSWGDVGKTSIKSGGASFGPLKVDSRGNVDPRSYYESALKQLEGSKLIGFVPKDGERFGIKKGTKEEWAKFMVQLTKQESSFNVNTVGDNGNSIGLSQMKAGEYGIKDPRDPLQAQKGMIKQFEKYILPFGAITGRGSGKGTYDGWGGASAYFGPLRGDSRIASEFNKPGNLQFMKKISPELEKLGEGLPTLSLPPRELLGGQTQQETQSPNQRTDTRVPKFFENGVPNVRQRAEIFKQGGVVVNLDTNWDERKNVQTGPLVVIPDNATKEQREAAEKYVKSIEASYAEKFGKSIKGQVKTRSQNKRGLGNTIHTEPFSVNDSKAVEYFTQTKEGRAALAKATQYLGDIPGAVISEPHNRFKKSPDLGAVSRYSIDPQTGKKVNEVGIARQLIGDLKSIYSQPVTENSERTLTQSTSMQSLSTDRIGMERPSVKMAFPMPQMSTSQQDKQNKLEKSGKSADQVIVDVVQGKIQPGDSIVEQALTAKGLHERRDRQQIMHFLKSGGKANSLDPYTTPWCAAFVNASLAKAGVKGTGTAWAPDFFKWGQRVTDPSSIKAGDIVVNNRHVSIATGPGVKDKNGRWSIPTVGGNESDMVKEGRKLFSSNQVRRATEQEYTPELIQKLKQTSSSQVEMQRPIEQTTGSQSQIDTQQAVKSFAVPSANKRNQNGWITSQSDRNWNQCVALSRAFNPSVGPASSWKVDASEKIVPGSMVASTQYGSGSTPGGRPGAGYHTGIAITSPDSKGNFLILDQWAGSNGKAQVRQVNVNGRIFGGQVGVVKGTLPSMAALETALKLTNNEKYADQIRQSIQQLQQFGNVNDNPMTIQQKSATGITNKQMDEINSSPTFSTAEILPTANEISRLKAIDEGIPVDKIDYSKEEERLKSIDEMTATREDISTYKTIVPSVQQDLPQPSGEITKEPGAIKPFQTFDASKISQQGMNMFAETPSIPGIPSPAGIAATEGAQAAFTPRPMEFEPPAGIPYPSQMNPATPEQAIPQSYTEGPAIAGAGMATAESNEQLNKKLDAAAETPVTTSTKPGGGDSGERSGASSPSNLGGGNHPESSAPEPGSGGRGSYGRCFV